MSTAAVGTEGSMVSSVGLWVISQMFQTYGSLFSIFGHRKTLKYKNRTEKRHTLFIVIDSSDRYLAWRPVYVNLTSYITISVLVHKLQYINSYCQFKYGLLIRKLLDAER